MSYKVKLKSFEGPFDLLVYLIENAEMSIYDIQVSEITSQYLAYIQTMKNFDIGVATEFMLLAAALIEIKSKMILPRTTMNGEILIEEDPRSELVERLLEYKKFKKCAEILGEKEEYQSNIFEKPQEDITIYLEDPDEYLNLDLKQFSVAFDLFLNKKKKVEEVRRHYEKRERQRITIEARIQYIEDFFVKNKTGEYSFKHFIPDKKDKYDVVLTFVSILEMAKQKFLRVNQKSLYGDISLSAVEKREVTNE